MGTLYVEAMELPSGNPTGGSTPLAAVLKMWHARARGEDDTE